MARLKLKYPFEKTLFSTTLKVRARDVNYGSHVGNDALVALLHEARIEWLCSLGYESELNVEGYGLIQIDLQVQYLKESYLGDLLVFHIALTETNNFGFELSYLVERDGTKIAIAYTNVLFFDYSLRQKKAFPQLFLSRLS